MGPQKDTDFFFNWKDKKILSESVDSFPDAGGVLLRVFDFDHTTD